MRKRYRIGFVAVMVLALILAACSAQLDQPSPEPAAETSIRHDTAPVVPHEGGIGGTGQSDDCPDSKKDKQGKECREKPLP